MKPAKPRKPVVEVVIHDKNGKTFDPKDPWSWTDKMRRAALAGEAQALLTLTPERGEVLSSEELVWLRDVAAFFNAYPNNTSQPAGEREWDRLYFWDKRGL